MTSSGLSTHAPEGHGLHFVDEGKSDRGLPVRGAAADLRPRGSTERPLNNQLNAMTDDLRERAVECAKDFKTSWVKLGQTLYSIWQDKMYKQWGYEKFEHYTERDLGLKNELSVKLLKTYLFLEQDEPSYLQEDFADEREASCVPHLDAVNVLRLAKGKKELLRDDYLKLKKAAFDKGQSATALRKDLTAMIRERKPVDAEEEREKRNTAAIKKIIHALASFEKDMEVLKLLPGNIIEETKELIKKLEARL
jgi:hypothetical protein